VKMARNQFSDEYPTHLESTVGVPVVSFSIDSSVSRKRKQKSM
jgi:hypothetical protein